jgi:membrane associated rhomboid family serine protease
MIPLRDDNPTTLPPVVTVCLVVACVLVFLWEIREGDKSLEWAVYSFGVIPAVLLGDGRLEPGLIQIPEPLTIITSLFLHAGWLHLIGNLIFLWIFGNNIEDSMGHGRFIVFYLLCGTVAALAQALPDPSVEIPLVGASGAISGVMGAYLLLFPHARVLVLLPMGFFTQLARLPASMVLGFWILLQIISSLLASPQRGGVAWLAHVGGFIAGMALIPVFKYSHVPLFRPRARLDDSQE